MLSKTGARLQSIVPQCQFSESPARSSAIATSPAPSSTFTPCRAMAKTGCPISNLSVHGFSLRYSPRPGMSFWTWAVATAIFCHKRRRPVRNASALFLPGKNRRSFRRLPGITFRVGLAQDLPLDSGCASKIVCNSVLLLLENENNVRSALTEISRVAQIGARIWLGEVPAADELAEFHVYNGTTTLGRLSHEWRTKGLRPFLATLRSVVRSRFGKQTLLLDSCSIFHAPPDKFIRLARACGLHIESWQKHKRLDAGGERESAFRYNYIFSKSA